MEIKILYEDSEIVVCVKPSGVLSQDDNKESMVSILSEKCKSEIFPLHRLDREVAGVMVYAKTKQSAAFLSKEIAERRFKKEYLAVVHGEPEKTFGEMCDLLFKDSSRNKSFVVKRMRKGVKDAKLEYNVIETKNIENQTFTKVHILLHTGRTHQIRVQFSSRKMPLLGDKKYGAKDNFDSIALWSYKTSFTHPKTNETVTFSAEPEKFLF